MVQSVLMSQFYNRNVQITGPYYSAQRKWGYGVPPGYVLGLTFFSPVHAVKIWLVPIGHRTLAKGPNNSQLRWISPSDIEHIQIRNLFDQALILINGIAFFWLDALQTQPFFWKTDNRACLEVVMSKRKIHGAYITSSVHLISVFCLLELLIWIMPRTSTSFRKDNFWSTSSSPMVNTSPLKLWRPLFAIQQPPVNCGSFVITITHYGQNPVSSNLYFY